MEHHHARPTFSIDYMITKSGKFIGLVKEVSGVMSQGDSLDELKLNLVNALKTTFEYHRKKMEDQKENNGSPMLTDELEYC